MKNTDKPWPWVLHGVFLIMFALKLGLGDTQVEAWSWWLVTSPLWVPAVILFVAALVIAVGEHRDKK